MSDWQPIMIGFIVLMIPVSFVGFIVGAGSGFFDWIARKLHPIHHVKVPSGILCLCGCDKHDHPFHPDGYGSCWNADTCGCKGYATPTELGWSPVEGAVGYKVTAAPLDLAPKSGYPLLSKLKPGPATWIPASIEPTHQVVQIGAKPKEIAGPLVEKRTILLDDEEG